MQKVMKPCKRTYTVLYYFYSDIQEHVNRFEVQAYSMKQAVYIFHKYNGYKGIHICDVF